MGTNQSTVSAAGGARLAFRGLGVALASGDVRRTYFKLALGLVVVSVALMVGLGYGFMWLLGMALDPAWLAGVTGWIAWLGAVVLAAVVAPLLALFVVNIVFPFLAEGVFFAGLRAVDPARAESLAQAAGTGFTASTVGSIRRLIYFVGVTLLCFAVSCVPLIGAVLGPIAQVWFTARMLSWELLDVYFERAGVDYAGQRVLLRRHRGAMFGFGLPWVLLMMLPLVGPLLFGLAQAAAAQLVIGLLERPESGQA
ncbi:MAG: EI24 domain-containing protein [Myxococcales bacterium]|nr:EI24 domain-containing protein [Myxococcales bacterium]